MTTIAWDGRTLAADKRCNIGSVHHTITKIRRGANGNLVGYAGNCSLGEEVLTWLCEGGERPEPQSEAKEFCSVIEITPDGTCLHHERWAPFTVENQHYAVGSGASFALAAMACGKTAAEAIEIAALFDSNTGNGVDVLPLKPAKPRAGKRRARA